MFLKKIRLVNYRNHAALDWQPDRKWNCITGLNGAGKTNVLDAIYMLCVLRSFQSRAEEICIQNGKDFYRLEGTFMRDDTPYEITVKSAKNQARSIEKNGKKYKRLSEHIGQYPVLLIQPIDDFKLLQSSSERRKIIDGALAQTDPNYLDSLMQYNSLLKRRNALLKSLNQLDDASALVLESFDQRLTKYATKLIHTRQEFTEQIQDRLQVFYDRIANNHETIELVYVPKVQVQLYEDEMRLAYNQDIRSGRSSVGPHRDDFNLILNDMELKDVGSQGQRKSYLFALKLSLYSYIADQLNNKPILLLDDLFDKLDDQRVRNLLRIINEDQFGQIFMTDKDDKHLLNMMGDLDVSFEHLKL